MGVFDDKKFEQLDWMSQMTETIESELNGLLARLPDRLELDFAAVNSFIDESYNLTLSADKVVQFLFNHLSTQDGKRIAISWEERRSIERCFEFETSDEIILDFKNGRMEGSVTLVKVVSTFSDEELQASMGRDGINAVGSCSRSDANIGRLNDVLELLGQCEHALKGRSIRRKAHAIRNRLTKIMSTNEWRIRDTTLANKVGFWIRDYVLNGNLAAYSNFCKLKVMTHSNMPIYSVEEQE